MPPIPCDTPAPISLRANFAATLAGNTVFAASQWAILSLIAKLGDSRMLGEYALALAIAAPVAMLSHLNLRAVLATDVARRHPFGDYLVVRLATAAAGLAALAAIALASGYSRPVAATIIAAGIALTIDNVSDIYHGLLQRRERLDQVARSMAARGLLSAAALGAALWLTGKLLPAMAALAATRLAVLLAYDRPVASAGESVQRTGLAAQAALFRTALPLGVVLMLTSLTANLPRYVIERRLGMAQLGAFAAVASLMTVGSTFMNALGQSATPRLARYFSQGEMWRFRRLVFRLAALALLLAAAGTGIAMVAGRLVLALLYRPAYSIYAGLLLCVMAASAAYYIAIALGFAITSARAFTAQVPLLAAAAGTAAAASWWLVPRLGLNGAVWALLLAWLVQITGALFILARALRRRGAAT